MLLTWACIEYTGDRERILNPDWGDAERVGEGHWEISKPSLNKKKKIRVGEENSMYINWEMNSAGSRFLNLGTTDILGWTILWYCLEYYKMLGSIPGFYALDASSTLP